MKAHKQLVFAGLVLLFGACSPPASPTAPDAAQPADGVDPRYGVMYGSGNRSEGNEEEITQTTVAADSGETAAKGGVMYGSGN